MKKRFTIILLLLSVILSHAQVISYVKQGGTGNGTSWAAASGDLQAMINTSGVTEVWVAAGTYKPTTGTDRSISFSMKNGVAIYGGFPSTGNPTMANRNWNTNQTILSGDIGTVGTTTDNTYRIIYNLNLNNSAVLDGVTICNAYQPTSFNGNQGGGVWNNSSSPTFRNCIIRNNYTAFHGGGVANENGSPSFSNCILEIIMLV